MQPEKAEVWTLTTQCLDIIVLGIYKLSFHSIQILKNHMTVKDITVQQPYNSWTRGASSNNS